MADKQVASDIQGLELKNVGNRVDNGLPCVPWISYDSDGDGEMMDKNKRRRLHVWGCVLLELIFAQIDLGCWKEKRWLSN